METDSIGLYVHIPFCLRKCNYCDFCSAASGEAEREVYISRLTDEIESYRRDEPITVDTLFFGGGTPSILTVRQLEVIMRSVRKTFRLAEDCEITLEVNPKTASEEKLRGFRELGINRLSIGMQSIHENEQKILGRIHNFQDFLDTYRAARAVGIANIGVDLMYGIPEQTLDSFEKTLSAVIKLSPEHIYCYGLIIEEGTPFWRERDRLPIPSEDEECLMYDLAHRILTEHGYDHYEISNYARQGYKSRHNLKYWHDEEYIGVGLSAHSYHLGKRYYNTSSMDEYISDGCAHYDMEDGGGKKDPFEYAMLALRLSDGILLSEYESLFGRSFTEGNEQLISSLISAEYIEISGGRLYLTPKGFYVSNSIMAELL